MTPEEAKTEIIENGVKIGAGDYVNVEALKVATNVIEEHLQTEKQLELYNKAVRRLERQGIKDPTAQIAALEKEIDYYREKIQALIDCYERKEEATT